MIKKIFLFMSMVISSIYAQDNFELARINYYSSNPKLNGKSEAYHKIKTNINYGAGLSENAKGFIGLDFQNVDFGDYNFSSSAGLNSGVVFFSGQSNHTFIFGVESSIGKSIFSNDFFKYMFIYKYDRTISENFSLTGGIFCKKELFDDLIFPLFGGQIKFNESLSLQALLPINLKLEQKLNDKLSLGILSEWDIHSVVHDKGYLRNEAIGMFAFLEFEFASDIFLEATLGKNVFSDSYLLNKLDDVKEEVKQKEGIILGVNLSYAIK